LPKSVQFVQLWEPYNVGLCPRFPLGAKLLDPHISAQATALGMPPELIAKKLIKLFLFGGFKVAQGY